MGSVFLNKILLNFSKKSETMHKNNYSKMLVFAILTIASVSCRSFEKRSAEAEPGFQPTFQSGSISQSYDCTGPNGCPNAGGFEFNTQNIRNQAAQFNQQYNQGSSAINISHGKKKRSAEADAKPGFEQTFQDGSHTQNFDCSGPNGCPGAGGFTFNTQNIRNQAASFNQQYNRGSSATNIDYYDKNDIMQKN